MVEASGSLPSFAGEGVRRTMFDAARVEPSTTAPRQSRMPHASCYGASATKTPEGAPESPGCLACRTVLSGPVRAPRRLGAEVRAAKRR